MTNQEFIFKVIDYYIESRNLTHEFENYRIWRGGSHSISSKTEDLFAFFIAKRLNRLDLELIVDKTMSYRTIEGKSIQFRPDLAIVNNGILTHIIDLKMDMGYKRRYHETEKFKSEEKMYQLLRNRNYQSVSYKEGSKRVSRNLEVSQNIKSQIVVVSEKNEGKSSNRTDMTEFINKLDWVQIYYLSGIVHPNSYDPRSKELIKVNDDAFENLINDINTNL